MICLCTQLRSVIASVFCQLGCDMSAQQSYVGSAAVYQLTATRLVVVSSIRLVRVKLLAPRHSAFIIAHTPPSAQDDIRCR